MIARELVAEAAIPGGQEMRLFRRGADFMIVLGGNELMNSRMSGSEEALATHSCERLASVRAPHLLIGGYGMGFTLRAALAHVGPDARVTVVELMPAILDWARGPMQALTAGCLDDPRVTVVIGDVAEHIRAARDEYDAILLDVDNGPDALTMPSNDGLYSRGGLATALLALKRGGVLAIWSAAPDARFLKRLRETGVAVEEVVVRARSNGKGPRHVLWFATR